MEGILLTHPITYLHASFRAFREREYHITRRAEYDVLILMTGGVLRFAEDGEEVELRPGDYYIQRRGGSQTAPRPSEAARYLFVHLLAVWGEEGDRLPRRGRYSPAALAPLLREMDAVAHGDAAYIARCGVLYRLLTALAAPEGEPDVADAVRRALEESLPAGIGLDALAARFHFSKNHLIGLFRRRFGTTPVAYLNRLRIRRASYLLEVTSEPTQAVAEKAGFSQYSHFYRLFLREMGETPSAYRQRVRKTGRLP